MHGCGIIRDGNVMIWDSLKHKRGNCIDVLVWDANVMLLYSLKFMRERIILMQRGFVEVHNRALPWHTANSFCMVLVLGASIMMLIKLFTFPAIILLGGWPVIWINILKISLTMYYWCWSAVSHSLVAANHHRLSMFVVPYHLIFVLLELWKFAWDSTRS